MGLLDDILKALDRVEIWKQLQNVPQRITDLETRVAEFEKLLSGNAPPDYCRLCGARAARLGLSYVELGTIAERWDCAECHNIDFRHYKPGPKS
jgi:hypothetical protein